MTIRDSSRQRFETMGIEEVQLFIDKDLFPAEMIVEAVTWAAQRKSEERALSKAANSESAAANSRESATSARRLDAREEVAKKRDNTARAIAVIAIIVAIVGMLISHWDAIHR